MPIQLPVPAYIDGATLTGAGSPEDPVKGSGGGPPSTATPAVVVYAPGLVGPSAPYYSTWAEIETAVNAVDGACQLWVDMTGLPGFAQVPASANLDGKGRLEIIGKGPNGEAELVLADGAVIKNVQTFRTIVFRGQSNTTPPLVWDIDGMIVECYDATFLFHAVCTQPVMALTGISYISFFFSDSSELRNSHNPGAAVLNVAAGVQCLLQIDTLFFPSSFDQAISGPVGSTLNIQTDASVPVISLPAFLGTLTQTNIDLYTPAVVVWRVGETWDVAYARLAAVAGPKICLVEPDPTTSQRAMTNRGGAPTDLNQVLFMGTSSVTKQSEGTTIVVADGTKFADTLASPGGLRCSVQSQWLSWDFSALTSPAYTSSGSRATWTQLGGQLKGSTTDTVFDGTLAVSLTNVEFSSGVINRTSLDTSTIEAQAGSSFFGDSWVTTAGNQIAILTDASCEWSLSLFVAGGWVMTGNVTVINFALGTANQLYSLSVNAGGLVVATLAP